MLWHSCRESLCRRVAEGTKDNIPAFSSSRTASFVSGVAVSTVMKVVSIKSFVHTPKQQRCT